MKISIEEVISNPEQPRKQFAEDQLNELAQSIKHDGLQYPILVRPKGDKYEIVQGERRYRAHIIVGLNDIDVEIRDLEDNDAFHLSVIENIQREQMTPIEEANAFLKYVEMGFTHEQIAKKVSKSRDYVTSRLRLLKLVPYLHDWMAEGYISDGHAKQLLKMESFLNRLLINKDPIIKEESHFERFQWNFHGSFWDKHHTKEKLTVNDVKKWVEDWHYGLVNSTILQYKGLGDIVVTVSRGLAVTAHFDCLIHQLHISNLIEEDIDFALSYDLERFKGKYNSEFRPWMIEKFWDEIKNELFYSDIDVAAKWDTGMFPEELQKSVDISKKLEEKSLTAITDEIKFYHERLKKLAEDNNTTIDEILDDLLISMNEE